MTIATARPAQVSATLAERLLARALAAAPHLQGQVLSGSFCDALERSVASRFKDQPRPPSMAEVERYLETLQHADLALACACAGGSEAAWEHFIRNFRSDLYAAARAVAKDFNPHELADSIYAELFGLEEREGKRRSLFQYFHGRSKLSTWLRAIVAQRFVDQVRAARRTVSLDSENGEGGSNAGDSPSGDARHESRLASAPAADPDRTRLLGVLQAVVSGAITSLDPRNRLRLSYYYVQDLTLAQIGRLLGEHEATVSRKLDRTRSSLRQRIEEALRQEQHMSDAQVRLCFDYAREEWPFDLTSSLRNGP